MPMLINKHRSALLVALALTVLPLAAQAQRKSPLADAPAIRKRFELRSTRLEFGAGMGTTINQDFYHTVLVQVKLGFHITDWLSLSGFGGFAVANMGTGYRERLINALPPTAADRRLGDYAPLQAQGAAALQQISSVFGGQLEVTPFTGKYSLFGKLFASYDFYGFAGPGFINVKPTDNSQLTPCSDTTSDSVCGVSGMKLGATFGVGMHTFFHQAVALNVELRDLYAQLNPSGRDVNGVGGANNADLGWTHTWMLGANVVLYLPTTASISQ
jgi:outer membrane beta-barrel protein